MIAWHTAALGDVIEFVYGKSLPKSVRESGGSIPVYGSNGITGWHNEALVPGPALVVGRKGSAGAVHYVEGACFPIDTTYYVKPREGFEFDMLFLYYLLRHLDLSRLRTATGVPGLTREDAYREQISFPPMSEQRRIVDLLSRAEGIVRLRREAHAKAQAIIPALFIDIFGDPSTNPKGWMESPLRALVEEFRYGTSNKSGESGLPALRIPNVVGDRLNPAEIKLVEVSEAEAARLRLLAGDLLFVRTNGNPDYVGRSAVFEPEVMAAAGFDGTDCVYASYLIRARLRTGSINPVFLQSFLSSHEGRKRLREQARTSAGQYNINTEGLGSIRVPTPMLDVQTSFEVLCRSSLGIVALQAAALSKAEATFQVLLTRAFSRDLATTALTEESAVA
jgi:type I restriction enzyme S subunit